MTRSHNTLAPPMAGAPPVTPGPPRAERRDAVPAGWCLLLSAVLATAACGPKPAANLDMGRPGAGSGAPGWEGVDWAPWAGGADSNLAGVQAEEHLAAAEGWLLTAGERHAAGDADGYRESLAEALRSLRAAEALMSTDPAAFAILRPAYETLITDLRSGLAAVNTETLTALDATPDELARAGEVHLANGASYQMPINPEDPLVAKYLALFNEGKRREFIAESFQRSNRYRGMVLEEIRKAGLPEELWVVPIVESGYKVSAYSRARAVGLWQFMATTGRNYGLTINEWVDERRDPLKSTRAALAYLKDLYLWFNNWDFALAAYNRGEAGIHRDIHRSRIADFMEMAELGATHPETQNHVPQIHAAAIIAKHPEKYGFQLRDEPAAADTVVIDYVVDLEVVARCVGATEGEMRELNPELRTWVTPLLSPDYPTYTLKLPAGTGERYRSAIAQVGDKTPKRQLVYVVRRGDTISAVARRFGVSVQDIRDWNGLRSNRLHRGQRLVVMAKQGSASERRDVASAPAAKSQAAASSSRSESGSLVMHTVRRGDTLFAIAQQYNTSVSELRRLNGLSAKGKIYPGQKLKVSR